MSAPDPLPGEGWIEGDFEGVYSGERRPRGSARGRRFDFELQSGTLHGVEAAAPPDERDEGNERGEADDADEVRQARVHEVALGTLGERTLYDVRIRDWRLLHPAEIRGRAFGTIVGRLRARLAPEPPDDPLPSFEPVAAELEPQAETQNEPAPAFASLHADDPVWAPLDEAGHVVVEPPDAARLIARLRTLAGWLVWLAVAGAFAWLCSVEVAALWAAPVAATFLLRRVAHRVVSAATSPWLGAGVVVCQLGLAFGHFESAWLGQCRPAFDASVAFASAPLVLAGLLRARWPLWIGLLLWTGVVCTWCAAGSGDCLAANGAGLRNAGLGAGAASRTDAGGRWPAWPGGTLPEILRPGGAPVAPEAPTEPPALPAVPAVPAVPALPDLPEPDGTLPPDAGAAAPVPDPPPASPPVTRRVPRGDVRSVPGGWVAPEEAADPSLVRISLEYANRNPEAFFEAAGRRLVYLQTDPIFEHGGSRFRARGPLELTRLANLLNLQPGRHVTIEVHTDAGGGPREQVARAERRAAAVHAFLVDRGHLDPQQFEVIGVGGGQPIVPPDGSYAAQQPNRRLEIRLVEADG